MRLKRILVPIDFSSHSMNALRYARELAQQFGAQLLLLHVIEPLQFITVADVYDEQRRLSDAALAHLGEDLTRQGVKAQLVVEAGVPSHVIAATGERSGVDLIVIGTHGRTGLAHVVIGSVAERVVRTATCPVLTVRSPARKRPPAAHKKRRQG